MLVLGQLEEDIAFAVAIDGKPGFKSRQEIGLTVISGAWDTITASHADDGYLALDVFAPPIVIPVLTSVSSRTVILGQLSPVAHFSIDQP